MSKYFIGLAHFAIRSIYFHFINFQFITVRFQIPLRPKPSGLHIAHRAHRAPRIGDRGPLKRVLFSGRFWSISGPIDRPRMGTARPKGQSNDEGRR